MVQTIIQAGVSRAKIHLIGLNLGAHLAAYVAKAIPGIGRLTGKLHNLILGDCILLCLRSGDGGFFIRLRNVTIVG
jgi:hypothetical protein